MWNLFILVAGSIGSYVFLQDLLQSFDMIMFLVSFFFVTIALIVSK